MFYVVSFFLFMSYSFCFQDVIGTSARTGEGLLDGLSWIKEKLGK